MGRKRMDVWNITRKEGDWPEALQGYERAVGILKGRDPSTGKPDNPLGWRFQAAMHGISASPGGLNTSNPLWSNCQHGSWFFLPWHRMYLLAFEMIIQDALEDESWSLPYWYAIDPDNPANSVLPPAFRDTSRPQNDLFVAERSQLSNGGRRLPNLSQSLLDALEAEDFSSADGLTSFGSGERATPSFNGEEDGLLESTPHGGVHVLVGNDYNSDFSMVLRRGLMGSPATAALDPIFWLHHANIDRLWQVWLDLDPAHRNPADKAWLDTEFSFPVPNQTNPKTWRIRDVLEMDALGYEYESLSPPSAVTPATPPAGPGEGDFVAGRIQMAERPEPRVIGAVADVPIDTPRPVDVELFAPDTALAASVSDDSSPARVMLRLEGVKGSAGAPVYDVYVNLPPGEAAADHPELRAGSFSTFGIAAATGTGERHAGSGKSITYDITSVYEALRARGEWEPDRLQVTFRPVVTEESDGASTAEFTAEEMEEATPSDLRADRITVITG
jgi:tyrosinase